MKSRNSNTEPGQPCISSKRYRIGAFARDMQKVQVAVRPRQLELREGVEPRFLRAPVEGPAPVLDKAAQVFDIRPV